MRIFKNMYEIECLREIEDKKNCQLSKRGVKESVKFKALFRS